MYHHLQNLTLCNPNSKLHGQQVDLIIRQGIITELSAQRLQTPDDCEFYDGKGAMLSPGWMDSGVWIGDPGFEMMEDLESAANAAIAGGFTALALLPETEPVMQTKSAVEYYRKRSQQLPVELYPIGALTYDLKGENLSELFDMHQAGAVAFTNAWRPLNGNGPLLRALQYTLPFKGKVVVFANEHSLSIGGQMHESPESVMLGMKGTPSLAEEMAVKSTLDLAKFANAPVHFSRISTAAALKLIKEAKVAAMPVTCDVSAWNLLGTDTWMADYDTNLKLMPPLREQSDVDALRIGLLDGTIDAISTDHCPKDPEHKELEFDYASFGAIGLQTLLPILLQAFSDKQVSDHIADWCCHAPRNIYGLKALNIEQGEAANFAIFNPAIEWTFDQNTNRSKSQNSFYFGKTLKGAVMATYAKGELHKSF